METVFDDIRAFGPEDLPAAYQRLAADPQFKAVIGYVFPDVPFDSFVRKMQSCTTNLQFQKEFCYKFLKGLLEKAATSCTIDTSAIDLAGRHTFISNHRDIVLDSALLDMLLIDAGSDTTCEIAIGDNLLAAPWIKDLVRVNKSFLVKRSAAMRDMLANSRTLSEYMHTVIASKNDNIWIAQREGRAKDSNDRTQQALLKMMAMGGSGTMAERLRQLHIVPLAISYEYDPCDFLKAAEFQLKRDVEGWKKSAHDDVVSMQTGIMGFKGQIHYCCAPCADAFIDAAGDMPKAELLAALAAHIDREIHRSYRLYAVNYVAADMLEKRGRFAGRYTEAQRSAFVDYVEGQIGKIDIPGKDHDFLFERIVTMYANPAINHEAAVGA